MKKYISTLFASFVLLSCTTKQAINTTPVNVASPVNNDAFFTQVTKKSVFPQVKINSKIEVQTGKFVPPLDATIYIENGQKVWMNMSAVFLNVARGVATPQGINGYEKLNKTYIESDFAYLNKLLNVNFINYSSLQNLLVGKAFVPVNANDFILTKNAQGYSLSSAKTQKVTVEGKISEYNVNMNYSPEFDLTKVVLQDPKTYDSLEVQYGNWVSLNNERFPQSVKIIIKGQKNSQILIENTKFDFAKMETPYSVPSNYTKKTIK